MHIHSHRHNQRDLLFREVQQGGRQVKERELRRIHIRQRDGATNGTDVLNVKHGFGASLRTNDWNLARFWRIRANLVGDVDRRREGARRGKLVECWLVPHDTLEFCNTHRAFRRLWRIAEVVCFRQHTRRDVLTSTAPQQDDDVTNIRRMSADVTG